MSLEFDKRISAAEAAKILGVPVRLISRLDIRGDWIKRYKLTRKTHVYDLDSLHAYLAAKLVQATSSDVRTPTALSRKRLVALSQRVGNSGGRTSLLDLVLKQKKGA